MGTKPILSDFTPFNPFVPPVVDQHQPTSRQLLLTALICLAVSIGFFATVHFCR